jgi:hypothetical protein
MSTGFLVLFGSGLAGANLTSTSPAGYIGKKPRLLMAGEGIQGGANKINHKQTVPVFWSVVIKY